LRIPAVIVMTTLSRKEASPHALGVLHAPPSKTAIRNRRLTFLNQSDYLASPKVQQRLFPFLYEKLVIQHKTLREKQAEESASKARTLTKVLFDAGDQIEKLERQRNRTEEERAKDQERFGQEEAIADSLPISTLENREESRDLLERLIMEKFLAGEDEEFDYAAVDNDELYDDWDTIEQDFREKYFDEEDPEDVEEGGVLTGETGVQDF
jgi:hypothetical protein